MKCTKYLLACALFACSTTLWAINTNLWHTARPMITLSAGALNSNASNHALTINNIDNSNYVYTPTRSHQTQNIFGTFIGAELQPRANIAWQTGLAYYQSTLMPRGTIVQGFDPQSSDTFTYKYTLTLQQWLFENKILWQVQRYHPYFLIGIGESYNAAGNYQSSNNPFVVFSPTFSSHTTKTLSYVIGIGIDMDIDPSWRIGAGYHYANFGKSKLGPGTLDALPLSTTLRQSRIQAQEVLAQLTYVLR